MISLRAPKPSSPVDKPRRLEKRFREQSVVLFIVVTVGAALALNGLKALAADAVPGLVSFLAPLTDFLANLKPEAWIGVLAGMLAVSSVYRIRDMGRIQGLRDQVEALKVDMAQLHEAAPIPDELSTTPSPPDAR
jgi:hypothetical protein